MKEKSCSEFLLLDETVRNGNIISAENTQESVRKKIVRQYVYIRKLKKMTQADVAKEAGISRTNITRFESGEYNPSLEMMVKIATALDVDLELKLIEKNI